MITARRAARQARKKILPRRLTDRERAFWLKKTGVAYRWIEKGQPFNLGDFFDNNSRS